MSDPVPQPNSESTGLVGDLILAKHRVCDGGGCQNELSTSGSLEMALLKLALHQSLAGPQEMAEILERERPELSTFAVRGGVQFI